MAAFDIWSALILSTYVLQHKGTRLESTENFSKILPSSSWAQVLAAKNGEKPTLLMTSFTTKMKPKTKKIFFLLQTRRLAESFGGLNSSLVSWEIRTKAQSPQWELSDDVLHMAIACVLSKLSPFKIYVTHEWFWWLPIFFTPRLG